MEGRGGEARGGEGRRRSARFTGASGGPLTTCCNDGYSCCHANCMSTRWAGGRGGEGRGGGRWTGAEGEVGYGDR